MVLETDLESALGTLENAFTMEEVSIHCMEETTLLSSGQTQVPARVRAKTQAKPGDKLVWEEMEDGSFRVTLQPRTGLADIVGLVDGLPQGGAVEAKRWAQRGGR